jgi:hypothetical protein
MTAAPTGPAGPQRRRGPVWAAGLLVALGAGVATAHGLYEVATAARVPAAIAWLYPLITDGLALVAYAATARLGDRGRGYAWSVVVLAAGLSGTAQASYLAGGVTGAPPAALRFGVGAWPAVAAAIVAHLLHLLGTATAPGPALTATVQPTGPAAAAPPVAPPAPVPAELPAPPAVVVPPSAPGGAPAVPDSPARAEMSAPPPVPMPPGAPGGTPATSATPARAEMSAPPPLPASPGTLGGTPVVSATAVPADISVPPAVPVPPRPPGGTPAAGIPGPTQPVRDTGPQHGTAGGRRTPKYTDAEVLARLAGRTAPVSVNAAVREFECGPDRARRLLARAGLLAPRDPAPSGATKRPQPPSTGPAQQPLPGSDDQPETEHANRRSLHLVHAHPDPRTER